MFHKEPTADDLQCAKRFRRSFGKLVTNRYIKLIDLHKTIKNRIDDSRMRRNLVRCKVWRHPHDDHRNQLSPTPKNRRRVWEYLIPHFCSVESRSLCPRLLQRQSTVKQNAKPKKNQLFVEYRSFLGARDSLKARRAKGEYSETFGEI